MALPSVDDLLGQDGQGQAVPTVDDLLGPEKGLYLRTMDTLADASGKVTEAIKAGAENVAQGVRQGAWQLPVSVNRAVGLGNFPGTAEAEQQAQQAQQEFAQSVEGAPFWERVGRSAAFGVGQMGATLPADIAMGGGIKALPMVGKAVEALPSFALGMGVRRAGDEGPMGLPEGVAEGLAMHGVGQLGQGLSVIPRTAAQVAGQGALAAGMTTADTLAKTGQLPTVDQVLESGATGAVMGLPFGLAPGRMGVQPRDSGVRIDTREAAPAETGGISLTDRIIQAESGGNPNAQAATSSARGMGQFVKGTRDSILRRYGVDAWSTDPAEQRRATELLIEDNRAFLRNALGREPSDGDVYMANFLGTGGAEQFLSGLAENPADAAVNHVSPPAARANRSIFFDKSGQPRTLQQVYDLMAAKVAPKDGETPAATPGARGALPTVDAVLDGQLPDSPRGSARSMEEASIPADMGGWSPDELISAKDSRAFDTSQDLTEEQLIRQYQEQRQRASEEQYGAKPLSPLWDFLRGRLDAKSISDTFGPEVLESLRGKAPRDLFRSSKELPEADRAAGKTRGQSWDTLEDAAKRAGLVSPDSSLIDTLMSNVTNKEQAQRDRVNGVNEIWQQDRETLPPEGPHPEFNEMTGLNSDGSPVSDVRFHLSEQSPAPQGLTPEDVAHGIDGYTKSAPGAAPVQIVRSQAELPPHILDEYRRSGETGAIEGVYDRSTQRVWLVADNLESKSRAGEIWLHENVAHHGLRSVFGSDKSFDAFLKRNAPRFGYGSDHIAMEEHIARLAEKMDVGTALTHQERTVWGQFVQWVRSWLVRHGWATPKAADLDALLRDSLTRMARGGDGQETAGGARFAVFRNNRSNVSPFNDAGYAMFAKNKDSVQSGNYGPVRWETDETLLPDIESVKKKTAKKFVEDWRDGRLPLELESIGPKILRDLNPDAIVNHAGVWDNQEFVSWFFDRIAEPLGMRGFQTSDGAVLFDTGGGGYRRSKEEFRFSTANALATNYQRDRIAFDGQPREPVGERVREIGREAYRKFVNKDQPLANLAKRGDSASADAIENQTRRLRGLGGIAEEMLTGKGALRYGIDGQETNYVPGTRSLKDILSPLKTQEQYRDYESLRAAERERALAIHRPELIGNDQARADSEISRLERKYGPDGMAKLRQVSAEHRQFERDAILSPLHEAGWISQAAYDAILNAPESKYYASFSREMEDVERQAVGSRDVVRKIKGSERKLLPSTEATIANVARAVKLVETLKLHQQIVDLRNLTPDLAQEIKLYKKGGLAPRDALVTVQNGHKTYWTAPPDVAKALDYFNPREVNAIVKAMALPAKWLRAGATLGLEFIARNPVRDQVSAFVFSKYGYNPATDFVRGLFHTIQGEWGKGSDIYSEWRAAGGAESFFTSLDRDAVRVTTKDLVAYRTGKDTIGKMVKNPLDALRAVSEFMEKGTRVGAFAKAREKGATPLEAMAEARDLTLDFSRMGSDTKVLNQIVAFWNANVQGVDKMARALKERPGQTLLRAGLGITLPSITLAMMNQGQQWYEELPAWQKDYFWCFNVGDTILRVPKPFELGILFGSLPERIVDFAHSRDPQGLKDVALAAKDALTPGWMPTAMLPAVETIANHSFFSGRPLENQAVQSLPPSMRYYSGTSEIAKRVGKLTDISPIKLENWFRSWTGSMGKLTLDASDLAMRDGNIPPVARTAADVPLVKGFVAREPIGSGSESMNRFYDNLAKTTQAQQGRKALLEAGDKAGSQQYDRNAFFAPAARALSSKMSDMRAEIAGIQQAPDISSEDKRTRIDTINRQMTQAAREFDEAYRSGQMTPEILYLGERSRVREAMDQYKELIKAGRAQDARTLAQSTGLTQSAGLVKWADAVMAKAGQNRKAADDPRLSGAQRAAYLAKADQLTQTALSEFQKRMGGPRIWQ